MRDWGNLMNTASVTYILQCDISHRAIFALVTHIRFQNMIQLFVSECLFVVDCGKEEEEQGKETKKENREGKGGKNSP